MAKGKICKVKDCKNLLKWNDGQVCGMHRMRWYRYKDYNYISPNWPVLKKGKPCLTKFGYFRISVNGKRVFQHRYIMEQYLGRELKKNECVHHINKIKTDNKIENLKLFKNNSKHMKKYHRYGWHNRKKFPPYSSKKISNIIKSINKPTNPRKNCFCGNKFMSRNLCSKHYQWAYDHSFF